MIETTSHLESRPEACGAGVATGTAELARQRAAYLAELASARLAGEAPEPPDPADLPACLVAERWGTRRERLDLDLAWLSLWRHAAAAPLQPRPAGWRDRYLDERGEEIDLAAELRALFRSPALRARFRQGASYRAHVALLEAGDPRAYLWRDLPTQRLLPPQVRFGLCAPEPAFYFAHGNVTRNCLAFHAPRCDNSDIVLPYLVDPAVTALEIYAGYRVVGQAWLVHGSDEAGRPVLLADSVEIHPASPAAVRRLAEPVRRACRAVAADRGAALLLNLRVYTPGAAGLAARWLDERGVTYRRRAPRPGRPLLAVDPATVERLDFRKATPWAAAGRRLRELGVRRFRYYLDAWAGFVDESHDRGEVVAVPW